MRRLRICLGVWGGAKVGPKCLLQTASPVPAAHTRPLLRRPSVACPQVCDAEDIAAELMSLPAHDANMRANVYMKRWKFPNTYTLGKHLTEHLVYKYQVTAPGRFLSGVNPFYLRVCGHGAERAEDARAAGST